MRGKPGSFLWFERSKTLHGLFFRLPKSGRTHGMFWLPNPLNPSPVRCTKSVKQIGLKAGNPIRILHIFRADECSPEATLTLLLAFRHAFSGVKSSKSDNSPIWEESIKCRNPLAWLSCYHVCHRVNTHLTLSFANVGGKRGQS